MRRTILFGLILFSCVGCRRLLSAALSGDDDAGAIDASALLAIDAAPVATADPVAADAAVAARPSATTASVTLPKCAKDEQVVQLDTGGARICATGCIDPSCDCQRGVVVLATGKPSSAPGDHASFCPHKKASAKKALPKCGAGQGLFASGEGDTPFCAISCGTDADCKAINAKCDGPQGFMVDDKTGDVFTGVGKSVPLCGKAGAAPAASASAAPQGSATRGKSK